MCTSFSVSQSCATTPVCPPPPGRCLRGAAVGQQRTHIPYLIRLPLFFEIISLALTPNAPCRHPQAAASGAAVERQRADRRRQEPRTAGIQVRHSSGLKRTAFHSMLAHRKYSRCCRTYSTCTAFRCSACGVLTMCRTVNQRPCRLSLTRTHVYTRPQAVRSRLHGCPCFLLHALLIRTLLIHAPLRLSSAASMAAQLSGVVSSGAPLTASVLRRIMGQQVGVWKQQGVWVAGRTSCVGSGCGLTHCKRAAAHHGAASGWW